MVEIPLPSLRERIEDIPLLVDHFLGLFAARYKREKEQLSRDAMHKLAGYDWPGNVRQLEHVLLNAWVLGDQTELETADIDLPDGLAPVSRAPSPSTAPHTTAPHTTEPPAVRPATPARDGAARSRSTVARSVIALSRRCRRATGTV